MPRVKTEQKRRDILDAAARVFSKHGFHAATVAQIAEATGWAQHTVRGFFAGLKKKGHAVEVKSRERMVGPNKTGAKGSFTIYHLPA